MNKQKKMIPIFEEVPGGHIKTETEVPQESPSTKIQKKNKKKTKKNKKNDTNL